MSIKVGDSVEILYFEETIKDAPSETIGLTGKVVGIVDGVNSLYQYRVELTDYNCRYRYLCYTKDQIKLV